MRREVFLWIGSINHGNKSQIPEVIVPINPVKSVIRQRVAASSAMVAQRESIVAADWKRYA
jgi:hypothetical protein